MKVPGRRCRRPMTAETNAGFSHVSVAGLAAAMKIEAIAADAAVETAVAVDAVEPRI